MFRNIKLILAFSLELCQSSNQAQSFNITPLSYLKKVVFAFDGEYREVIFANLNYMTHTAQHTSHMGSKLLALTIAGIVAGALGLLFTTEKGKEIREEAGEKAKELAKKFDHKREEIQENVREIFGNVTDDLERAYIDIRSLALTAMDELKEKGQLSKARYEEAIRSIVDDFAEERNLSKKESDNLRKSLFKDWESLKSKF